MSFLRAAAASLKVASSSGLPRSALAAPEASNKVCVAPAIIRRALLTAPVLLSRAMDAPKFTKACAKTWRWAVLKVWKTVPRGIFGITMDISKISPFAANRSVMFIDWTFESWASTSKVAPAAARMVTMSD